MEKNIPAKRNKYRKGDFEPGFLIIWAEKKHNNFKNNMNDQKMKTLVSTVAMQNLCASLSMAENNVIILNYILN